MAGDKEIRSTGNPTDAAGDRWSDMFPGGNTNSKPSPPPGTGQGKGSKVDYRVMFQAFANYENVKQGKAPVNDFLGDAKKTMDPKTWEDPRKLLGNSPEPWIESAKKAGVGSEETYAKIREWWNQSGPKDAAPDPSVATPRRRDAASVIYP